jgi:hypothetical protein
VPARHGHAGTPCQFGSRRLIIAAQVIATPKHILIERAITGATHPTPATEQAKAARS